MLTVNRLLVSTKHATKSIKVSQGFGCHLFE